MSLIVTKANKGEKCIIHNNFKYKLRRDRCTDSFLSWVCTHRTCYASVKTNVNINEVLWISDRPHNHEMLTEHNIEKCTIRQAVKGRAVEDLLLKPFQIIQEEIGEANHVTTKDVDNLRVALRRERIKIFGKLPSSLDEASLFLKKEQVIQSAKCRAVEDVNVKPYEIICEVAGKTKTITNEDVGHLRRAIRRARWKKQITSQLCNAENSNSNSNSRDNGDNTKNSSNNNDSRTSNEVNSVLSELNEMLLKFRTQDLQSLLGAMNTNKSGRKIELYARAKELLMNPAKDFNSDVYVEKIRKLYAQVLSETKMTNGLAIDRVQTITASILPDSSNISRDYRTSQLQCQQEQQGLQHQRMQMQPPMEVPPPLYAGYLTMNDYPTYISYPQQGPQRCQIAQAIDYGIIPQIAAEAPTYQYQLPITSVIQQNNSILTTSPGFHYQLQYVPNLTFKKLPFYKIRHTFLRPTALTVTGATSLPSNYPKLNVTIECSFYFVLTVDQINSISDVMDVRECDYPIQALLRIGQYNNNYETKICEDFMPIGLLVRANNEQVTLPSKLPITKPGMDIRRQPRPINLTGQLKLNPDCRNNVKINWIPEPDKKFCFALYICERLTSKDLLNFVLSHRLIQPSVTKDLVVQRVSLFENDDDDDVLVSSGKLTVSLTCPLGASRLVYPSKGKDCGHIAFFDALNYISLNEKKPSWTCPICRNAVPFDNMEIYQFFVDILKSDNLPADCTQVELLADGSWKISGGDLHAEDDCDDDDSDLVNGNCNKRSKDVMTNLDGDDEEKETTNVASNSDVKSVIVRQLSNDNHNNNENSSVTNSITTAVVNLTEDNDCDTKKELLTSAVAILETTVSGVNKGVMPSSLNNSRQSPQDTDDNIGR